MVRATRAWAISSYTLQESNAKVDRLMPTAKSRKYGAGKTAWLSAQMKKTCRWCLYQHRQCQNNVWKQTKFDHELTIDLLAVTNRGTPKQSSTTFTLAKAGRWSTVCMPRNISATREAWPLPAVCNQWGNKSPLAVITRQHDLGHIGGRGLCRCLKQATPSQ